MPDNGSRRSFASALRAMSVPPALRSAPWCPWPWSRTSACLTGTW